MMFDSEQLPRQLLRGIGLLLVGLCILLASALNTPPALQRMIELELPLSGAVRIARGGRSGAYIAVPLGTMRGEVRHLCSLADCAMPPHLAELRPGAVLRVWLNDRAIWQLQYQGQLLVDYADVRADYQHERRMAMGLALLLIGAGAVLVYWGLHPAPAPLTFLS